MLSLVLQRRVNFTATSKTHTTWSLLSSCCSRKMLSSRIGPRMPCCTLRLCCPSPLQHSRWLRYRVALSKRSANSGRVSSDTTVLVATWTRCKPSSRNSRLLQCHTVPRSPKPSVGRATSPWSCLGTWARYTSTTTRITITITTTPSKHRCRPRPFLLCGGLVETLSPLSSRANRRRHVSHRCGWLSRKRPSRSLPAPEQSKCSLSQ
mmetsp:Transcript_6732/g.15542  ORF Transcript_6732/g.15542 Transcript_6732/m.15542 type:complete len:207 (-) Transcript_6732:10-630(-)